MKKLLIGVFVLLYASLIAALIFWVFPNSIGSIQIPNSLKKAVVAVIITLFCSFFLTKDKKEARTFWIETMSILAILVSFFICFFAWSKNINFQDWLKLFTVFNIFFLFAGAILYFVGSITKKFIFSISAKKINLTEKINNCIYKVLYTDINIYNWNLTTNNRHQETICYDTFGQFNTDLIINFGDLDEKINLIVKEINEVFFNMPNAFLPHSELLKTLFSKDKKISLLSKEIFVAIFKEYLDMLYYDVKKNRKVASMVLKTIKNWGVSYNGKTIKSILALVESDEATAIKIYTHINNM